MISVQINVRSSRAALLLVAASSLAFARGSIAQTIEAIDDAALPRFAVASVKPSGPNGPWRFGFPPGGFAQEHTNLIGAIGAAFHIRLLSQLANRPKLIEDEVFTINARSANAEATVPERALMLRALLIDRFKLRYHIQRSETDGFVLTMARPDRRLGSKLRASTRDCVRHDVLSSLPPGCALRNARGTMDFEGRPIAELISMLSSLLLKPIDDQTGLNGTFDVVDLHYSIESVAPTGLVDTSPLAAIESSIVTAVREQLGLRLVPRRLPVDRVFIDHIERPDPD